MNHTRRRFLGLIGTGALTGGGVAGTASAQAKPVVVMENNYFDPVGLFVEPGTTVRFEIGAGGHSATAYPGRVPAGADAFDSGVLSSGSYDVAFEAPGTYDYYCIPHESVGMVGRIVVGRPGGPAEDSPVPDGEVPASDTIVERGSVAYGADTDSGGSAGGGMMGRGMGGGMMGGRGMGWYGGLPFVGGALGALGLGAGALYWALRRDPTGDSRTDPAVAALRRRYARGEFDEAEFGDRLERLRSRGENANE